MFLDILDSLSSSLWDMNYTVKNVVFELIFRLLKRSELSDLTLLGWNMNEIWEIGFDPAKTDEPPKKEDVEFAANLRRVLLHILSDVLLRVCSNAWFLCRLMRKVLVSVSQSIVHESFVFVCFGFLPLEMKWLLFYGINPCYHKQHIFHQHLRLSWVRIMLGVRAVSLACRVFQWDLIRILIWEIWWMNILLLLRLVIVTW